MEDFEAKERLDILESKVSKVVALAVLNLESIMYLSSALLQDPDLPDPARKQAKTAFDGIQAQIDLMNELAGLSKTDEKPDGK